MGAAGTAESSVGADTASAREAEAGSTAAGVGGGGGGSQSTYLNKTEEEVHTSITH